MPLALTRRPGQSLVLTTREGQRIEIEVRSVDEHGDIRLGINAPRDVLVLRAELVRD
ncbi:MAG TPA: carbon storage regulator [Baekduia sp.]|uniref:carbon storage regulator n=1 Tax=Baekduia sp. TaxID=2600305 RepID=UPI002C026DCD|nr:carbon storage regulator [Baekduia sp.]HMJ33354.1 carbon storage regulator [Baekduia sp.]